VTVTGHSVIHLSPFTVVHIRPCHVVRVSVGLQCVYKRLNLLRARHFNHDEDVSTAFWSVRVRWRLYPATDWLGVIHHRSSVQSDTFRTTGPGVDDVDSNSSLFTRSFALLARRSLHPICCRPTSVRGDSGNSKRCQHNRH